MILTSIVFGLTISLSIVGIMSWIQQWLNARNTKTDESAGIPIILVIMSGIGWGIFYYLTH